MREEVLSPTESQLFLFDLECPDPTAPAFLWWCYNASCFYQNALLDEYDVLWRYGHACCPSCHQPCKREK